MSLQSEDKRIYILKSEKPAKAVVKLGVPLIAGMFIMVLYNLVDTYFIGLMHDDYQLAAVNLAYPVMMISIAISNMIGTGASSLIARSLGAGDNEKANHTLTAGFVLTVVNSVLVAGIGLILLNAIVKGLGAQENTFDYTRQYVQVILAGSLLTMGNYTFGQLLRSEGSVKQSVAGMIAGTVVNIILDPIFIFTLGMEIRGAAIATILGNGAGMLVSLYYYLSGKTLLRPSFTYIRPTAETTCTTTTVRCTTTTSLVRSVCGSRCTTRWSTRRRSAGSAFSRPVHICSRIIGYVVHGLLQRFFYPFRCAARPYVSGVVQPFGRVSPLPDVAAVCYLIHVSNPFGRSADFPITWAS